MPKRKVDEYLEVMRDAGQRYAQAARKIIRYGNICDFKDLREELALHEEFVANLVATMNSQPAQERLHRELDRIRVEGVLKNLG